MANLKQTSLIIKKESLYEKIRKSLITLIYQKDAIMIQQLEELLKPQKPNLKEKIIIPKEIGKEIIKYEKEEKFKN